MSIRKELINRVYDEAYLLIHNEDISKRFSSLIQYVSNNELLTKDEKSIVIKRYNSDCDYFKVIYNEGKRSKCENCKENRLATFYCEYCIRKYLESNFPNWSSGNNNVDKLIKDYQINSIAPNMIIEWIPYENFENIEILANGGNNSDIYSSVWKNGQYNEWNSSERKLKRSGSCKVILKYLETDEIANRTWFEEARTRLYFSNKWGCIVQSFGLTKNPSDKRFILVTLRMDISLKDYILRNSNKITWKTKMKIIFELIKAICRIHEEKYILRDLHPGNILYSQFKNDWYINDLKFCSSVNKPLYSIYGKLPYIAPEVINGYNYSFKSDIYSIGMIMWELAFEQSPFNHLDYDQALAISIVNGLRPKLSHVIPTEYKELIIKCFDNDPEKRPDIKTLWINVENISKLIHRDEYWNSILKENHSQYYY